MGLRFRRLAWHRVAIPFRFRHAHALADRRSAESLLLSVETESGRIGWGECVPRGYLTGETVESCLADLEARCLPWLSGVEIASPAELLAALRPLYGEMDLARRTAAYSGFELACLDAAGREADRPARSFLPAPASPPRPLAQVDFTAPIGGGSIARVRALSLFYRALGFREAKLKLGFPDDAERLRVTRQALGQGIDLRVDVNAAWDLGTALARVDALRRSGVSSVEQPLPAREIDSLARFRRESGLAVMADESLCTRADAAALLEAGACSLFNLRLAKSGGYSGVCALRDMGARAGAGAQLGVLVGETAVLAAAAQELLAASAPFRHQETAFPRFFLRGDPAAGESFILLRGRTWTEKPVRPGFGVTVDPARLTRVTTASGSWSVR